VGLTVPYGCWLGGATPLGRRAAYMHAVALFTAACCPFLRDQGTEAIRL